MEGLGGLGGFAAGVHGSIRRFGPDQELANGDGLLTDQIKARSLLTQTEGEVNEDHRH